MHYKMTVERFCIFKRSYQLYIFGHFCLWFAVTLTLCRHHSGLFASSWQRTPTVFLVILWFFFFFFFFWYLIESKILFDLKKKNKLHLYLVLWANFSTCTSRLSIPGYSCMTNKKNFFKNFWFEQNGSVYIWFNVSGRSNFLMKIILQKILIKENLVFKIKAISFTPTHKYY